MWAPLELQMLTWSSLNSKMLGLLLSPAPAPSSPSARAGCYSPV